MIAAAPARADLLLPPPGQVFFGVSDTGKVADFNSFSDAVGKHPALIETFHPYGNSLPKAISRWQSAQARPVLHISTENPNTLQELITPAAIATGSGDDYLLSLNGTLSDSGIRTYIRPMGEPNRCLNAWTAIDCSGHMRDAQHTYYWYKQAFRRMYIVIHGGGTVDQINAKLAAINLPPLAPKKFAPEFLPAAPVAVIWSPLPVGSPAVKANLPAHYYPGDAYTDWVGTDLYSNDASFPAALRFYRHFTGKPFAFAEWGVKDSDNPGFVKKMFQFVRQRRRTKMFVYYQDFGESNSYRIQNYGSSLNVLRARLHSGLFPAYARGAPHLPPPPPGGVGAR
jgi:hypothetical protein